MDDDHYDASGHGTGNTHRRGPTRPARDDAGRANASSGAGAPPPPAPRLPAAADDSAPGWDLRGEWGPDGGWTLEAGTPPPAAPVPSQLGAGTWSPPGPAAASPRVPASRPGSGAARSPRGHRREQPRSRLDSPAGVLLTAVAAALLAGSAVASLRLLARHPAAGPGGTPASTVTVLPGYPGMNGSESVQALAAAGTVDIAAGSAGNAPAIWRRSGTGPWTLETFAATAAPAFGTPALSAVAHGPGGWIAAGTVTGGDSSGALVLASPDGITWHAVHSDPLSGSGLTLTALAAGAQGYVAAGTAPASGTSGAALWWSPDLVDWTRTALPGSQVLGVTATPAGFLASGTHDGCHTIWASSNGQQWQTYDLSRPPGTSSPVLRQVTVSAGIAVAAGDISSGGRRYPLVIMSVDGGRRWRETALGGAGTFTGPPGTVTALSPDGTGFVAAGLSGPPGRQQPVTWTSPNGLQWSEPAPAASSTVRVTALAADGNGQVLEGISVNGGQAEVTAAP